ncbi:hypothetical protein CXG81DRAFT_17424 [Caulochytrium protostelioides]|uniref:Uncharacterized protein n=1 Tax=Caulochytrium protostelioides TaxID=1555241 RepID=A0A4P9XC44_9FUNG|nr:hypothetical protein CXG81DRAFT_17424 [Caulochytrium protostelioides]|eukprot:RKP02983.1 hypothetical protein CXG81DRAFT_17424 [Caulochytrium protostelioides]
MEYGDTSKITRTIRKIRTRIAAVKKQARRPVLPRSASLSLTDLGGWSAADGSGNGIGGTGDPGWTPRPQEAWHPAATGRHAGSLYSGSLFAPYGSRRPGRVALKTYSKRGTATASPLPSVAGRLIQDDVDDIWQARDRHNLHSDAYTREISLLRLLYKQILRDIVPACRALEDSYQSRPLPPIASQRPPPLSPSLSEVKPGASPPSLASLAAFAFGRTSPSPTTVPEDDLVEHERAWYAQVPEHLHPLVLLQHLVELLLDEPILYQDVLAFVPVFASAGAFHQALEILKVVWAGPHRPPSLTPLFQAAEALGCLDAFQRHVLATMRWKDAFVEAYHDVPSELLGVPVLAGLINMALTAPKRPGHGVDSHAWHPLVIKLLPLLNETTVLMRDPAVATQLCRWVHHPRFRLLTTHVLTFLHLHHTCASHVLEWEAHGRCLFTSVSWFQEHLGQIDADLSVHPTLFPTDMKTCLLALIELDSHIAWAWLVAIHNGGYYLGNLNPEFIQHHIHSLQSVCQLGQKWRLESMLDIWVPVSSVEADKTAENDLTPPKPTMQKAATLSSHSPQQAVSFVPSLASKCMAPPVASASSSPLALASPSPDLPLPAYQQCQSNCQPALTSPLGSSPSSDHPRTILDRSLRPPACEAGPGCSLSPKPMTNSAGSCDPSASASENGPCAKRPRHSSLLGDTAQTTLAIATATATADPSATTVAALHTPQKPVASRDVFGDESPEKIGPIAYRASLPILPCRTEYCGSQDERGSDSGSDSKSDSGSDSRSGSGSDSRSGSGSDSESHSLTHRRSDSEGDLHSQNDELDPGPENRSRSISPRASNILNVPRTAVDRPLAVDPDDQAFAKDEDQLQAVDADPIHVSSPARIHIGDALCPRVDSDIDIDLTAAADEADHHHDSKNNGPLDSPPPTDPFMDSSCPSLRSSSGSCDATSPSSRTPSRAPSPRAWSPPSPTRVTRTRQAPAAVNASQIETFTTSVSPPVEPHWVDVVPTRPASPTLAHRPAPRSFISEAPLPAAVRYLTSLLYDDNGDSGHGAAASFCEMRREPAASAPPRRSQRLRAAAAPSALYGTHAVGVHSDIEILSEDEQDNSVGGTHDIADEDEDDSTQSTESESDADYHSGPYGLFVNRSRRPIRDAAVRVAGRVYYHSPVSRQASKRRRPAPPMPASPTHKMPCQQTLASPLPVTLDSDDFLH